MIRGFYSAASGMLVQFLRQQVLSTNLANVNTVGYKQARLVSKASAEVAIPGAAPSDFGATFADLLGADSPAPVGNVGGGALAEPVATDWSEGMIRVTHEDTDLALTGPGFFRVQAPNGQTLYTRAGNFGRQTDGSLVTADGNRVMGQNGPIALPAQGKLEVKPDGSVYVEGHFLDRLAIDDLPPDAGLQPVGQNSFQVTNPNATILASTDTTVGQGQLESSNVDLPQAMVDMMSAMRTYEASQKILQMEDQTVQRAVNDVGRLAPDLPPTREEFEVPLGPYGISASGLRAQQLDLDVISNNLANVNTPGFQAGQVNFADLLSSQLTVAQNRIDQPNLDAPYVVSVGSGVRPEAITRSLSPGTLMNDGDPLHLAIQGDGYFVVQMPDGTAAYTRAGAFGLDPNRRLVTTDGNYVLPNVTLPANVTDLAVTPDGLIYAHLGNDPRAVQIGEVQLAHFANPQGLLSIGHNLFRATTESGPAAMHVPGDGTVGAVASGFLEASNVDVANEMTAMILAERAYQLNVKSLQTIDQMVGMANNLRA